ncbi:protein ABHD1-like [Sycon ciliatum]|uniref:protein ABHD1-like n=1 Tax=Sycon ciliatum TaxID=27933 RepID=UPI0031F67616
MDAIGALLTYPVRVLWNAIKSPVAPQWSRTRVVHHEDGPPDWLVELRAACSSLEGFFPSPWAPDGHSQTVLGVLVHDADSRVKYEREVLDTPDNDKLALDWASMRGLDAPKEDAPVCMLFHGLSGDSSDMESAAGVALQHGMRAVAVSKRGQAPGLDLVQPKLLSFGDTGDLRHVCTVLKERYPNCELVGLGSSAGGGQLASYLQDYPTGNHLDGVAVLSPGYDSKKLFSANDTGTVPWPYGWILLRGMKRIVEKNRAVLKGHIDVEKIKRCATFNEFYAEVDFKLYDYKDTDELWDACNPLRGDFLGCSVPTLCISSVDDPVVPEEMIPISKMQTLWKSSALLITEHGGHCGFLEGWSGRRWDYHVACTFLTLVSQRARAASDRTEDTPSTTS